MQIENVKVIKQISTKQGQRWGRGGSQSISFGLAALEKKALGSIFCPFPGALSLTQRSNLLIISLHCTASNISFSPNSCFSKPNDASPNQFVCILFHIPSCDSLPFYNPALLATNHCSPCSNK